MQVVVPWISTVSRSTTHILFDAGDRKAVAQYLCQKYPQKFRKIASAQTFICRTMKKVKKANEDAGREADAVPPTKGMKDSRSVGAERRKPVSENPAIVEILERVLEEHNGNIKEVLRQCRAAGLKASLTTLNKMAWKMGYGWQKAWHTDVLTPAQKFKRVLFCRKLLRLSKQNLIRIISAWIFTDEKWFDLCGPSPGQWVRAATKALRKMGNQVCF